MGPHKLTIVIYCNMILIFAPALIFSYTISINLENIYYYLITIRYLPLQSLFWWLEFYYSHRQSQHCRFPLSLIHCFQTLSRKFDNLAFLLFGLDSSLFLELWIIPLIKICCPACFVNSSNELLPKNFLTWENIMQK